MKHQPFEAWLLEEKPINARQKLELDAHLRDCGYCAALAETGRALRSVKKVSPASGAGEGPYVIDTESQGQKNV